jgi:hypothetical protein
MNSKSSILSPFKHFMRLYGKILSSARSKDILIMLVGLLCGWWLYVPIHELMHVAGCILSGGSVQRLELSPLYGGLMLSHVFDFIVAGGDYAGRLSGFNYKEDWSYAVTVFFPYILSLPGFLLLEKAVENRWHWLYGAVLPLTFAPLISLTGDMFELGSLSLYQMWSGPEEISRLLISDDMFLLMQQIHQGELATGFTTGVILFVGGSFFLAVVLTWSILLISTHIGLLSSKGQ